jgi:hypothetical protein
MANPFEYIMLLRPYSFATVPPGVVGFRPSKLPKKYPHGVVQYERPLSKDQVEHFSMQPLDPRDPWNYMRVFEAWMQEMQARFVDDGGILVFDDDETGARETLTYSTRPGVDFQRTHWIRLGGRGKAHVGGRLEPVGHDEYDDFREAITSLFWNSKERARLTPQFVPDA